ncbi:MAG: redoxin domain-containing protein, partial [Candidatus Stahlbacteria bacterium]|nr:redoxin domain-containing protein [Candidatus Stahlbacteria bacterium]
VQNTYFKLHSVPSLGHQLVLIGGGFPELNPSLFMGIKDWSPKLIDSIILKCTEIVEGDTLYLIEMSMMEGQRVREIWVSKKDWLPRKIIRTVKVASPLITEEVWSEIKINQDITDDSFNWKPTKEWNEEDSRIITGDKTLPKNSVAPPFSFLSIDGDTISLSDFKGKVLWLCFWRVGCPPCRTGMPYIQKIYEKLKSKGLCVLGFNCADDKEIVIKYFEKNKITFPNILDNSEEARKTGQKYYNNKVPLHYIIDRDGKIFDTYIGYDGKEYQEIEKILEQLDVK